MTAAARQAGELGPGKGQRPARRTWRLHGAGRDGGRIQGLGFTVPKTIHHQQRHGRKAQQHVDRQQHSEENALAEQSGHHHLQQTEPGQHPIGTLILRLKQKNDLEVDQQPCQVEGLVFASQRKHRAERDDRGYEHQHVCRPPAETEAAGHVGQPHRNHRRQRHQKRRPLALLPHAQQQRPQRRQRGHVDLQKAFEVHGRGIKLSARA